MIRGTKVDKNLLYDIRGLQAYQAAVETFDRMEPSVRLHDLITDREIKALYDICMDARLQCRIKEKFEEMKKVLTPLGFVRYINGTNRVCFTHIDYPDIILKVAIDKVGLRDSLSEYEVQKIFKPYVCKIYEVDPSGVVALIERVNPIKRHDQLALVADEMYDVLNRFFGASKFLMEDIGEKYFLNWGIRRGFGLILLDYPYLYKLDKQRVYCTSKNRVRPGICGGIIDYDEGFNHLRCKVCGLEYKVRDVAHKINPILEGKVVSGLPIYNINEMTDEDEFEPSLVYVTDENGKVVKSGNIESFNITVDDIESGRVDDKGHLIQPEVEKEAPSTSANTISKRHMAMIILDDIKEHGVDIPEEYLNKIRALYNIQVPEKKEDAKTIESDSNKPPRRSLFKRVDPNEEKPPLDAEPKKEEPKKNFEDELEESLAAHEMKDAPSNKEAFEEDPDVKEVASIQPANKKPTKEEIARAAANTADMFRKYEDEDYDDTYEDSAMYGDDISDEDIDNLEGISEDNKKFIKYAKNSSARDNKLEDKLEETKMSIVNDLGLPKKAKEQDIPAEYLDLTEDDRNTLRQMSGDKFIDMMFSLFDETKTTYMGIYGAGHLMENNPTFERDLCTVMDLMLGRYMISNDLDIVVDEVKSKAKKLVQTYYESRGIIRQFKALDREVNDSEREDKARSTDKRGKRKFKK